MSDAQVFMISISLVLSVMFICSTILAMFEKRNK